MFQETSKIIKKRPKNAGFCQKTSSLQQSKNTQVQETSIHIR